MYLFYSHFKLPDEVCRPCWNWKFVFYVLNSTLHVNGIIINTRKARTQASLFSLKMLYINRKLWNGLNANLKSARGKILHNFTQFSIRFSFFANNSLALSTCWGVISTLLEQYIYSDELINHSNDDNTDLSAEGCCHLKTLPVLSQEVKVWLSHQINSVKL